MDATLRECLADAEMMLDADGFDLVIESATPIVLRVRARAEACDDCLVGKDVMAGIVADLLGDEVAPEDVSLRYPGEP